MSTKLVQQSPDQRQLPEHINLEENDGSDLGTSLDHSTYIVAGIVVVALVIIALVVVWLGGWAITGKVVWWLSNTGGVT